MIKHIKAGLYFALIALMIGLIITLSILLEKNKNSKQKYYMYIDGKCYRCNGPGIEGCIKQTLHHCENNPPKSPPSPLPPIPPPEPLIYCVGSGKCGPGSLTQCATHYDHDSCVDDGNGCCEWIGPPPPKPSPPDPIPPSEIRGWNCKGWECVEGEVGEPYDYRTESDCQIKCSDRYTCDENKWKCVPSLDGTGDPLDLCQQRCQPSNYECDRSTNTCHPAKGGGGDPLEICQKYCRKL